MRRAGVLMPISSLPSPWGIGTMGAAARSFVDFLAEGGQSCWQILPVGPTSYGDSPYQSFSSFAGNPYFIDLDDLAEEGLLEREEYAQLDWGEDPSQVDYDLMYQNRYPVLRLGSLDIHKYIDLINAFQECTLEHGKMVFQLGILHQMLAYLQDDFLRFNSDGATLTRQDNLVCELINYINLHIGEDLSLKTLGKVTNYNPTYLSRTFKSITRSTLKLYIDEKRINTATLLMGKGTPLTEIAMEVGFQNYCTFYNTFRRIMGVSPESYARTQGNEGKDGRRLVPWQGGN